MKISVQSNNESSIITVAVTFKSYISGESYVEQIGRIRNFTLRAAQGYVKQFYPKWYKDTMTAKRNQTVGVNSFVKEMN